MKSDIAISRWLLVIMVFISIIIVVGAITRLTNSGLSMPFWDLIEIIPPISDHDWEEKFTEYRLNSSSDQMEQGINDVSDFKVIFFWEYFHRLIARIIGLIAIIPYFYFLLNKSLTEKQKKNYAIIIGLIIIQGIVGWLMVKSGLDSMNYNQARGVLPYWLMTHLSIAFFTFCFTFNNYLDLRYQTIKNSISSKLNYGSMIFIILFIQILFGALMSGYKAAYLYPTFPLMEGLLYPQSLDTSIDYIKVKTFVNFFHRWFAFLVLVSIMGIYVSIRKKISVTQYNIFNFLFYAILVQIFFGILSLVYPVIPFEGTSSQIAIASIHQFGAIILLATTTVLRFSFQHK